MNLFIIPSWYPSAAQPLSGVFVKEQAEAIAEMCPDIHVIMSTWGHLDCELQIRHPFKCIEALKWRMQQRENKVVSRDNMHEVFNPCLTWTEKLPVRSIGRLISVNRANFSLASRCFGKIDLIHAHVSYPAGYIASILAKEYDIPYVMTEHMGPFPLPHYWRDGKPFPEITEAFAHASKTVAVSPALAKQIAALGYREPCVIPNAIDEKRFSMGKPSSSKFVFFTLCGLTRSKGIDHLLEAIARWNPPADRFEFRIGGDGPMRGEYETLSRNLGVSDRVKWLGEISREEAPELFRSCHVYVMPSQHETFGVVFAEAIASGKPVIATRCGGPEFIVNNANGRMVDVGDIDALANTMQWMAENWSAFDPVAIRDDFMRRFSREAVVNQLHDLYKEILKK
jgi:glycosyltransferase involved in cell wall biosynthesis